MKITIRIPATSANLGPGFDALGLALDLWNEVEISPADKFSMIVEGEGMERLPPNPKNHIVRSLESVYQIAGKTMPELNIRSVNRIPLGSGLGSSAAAVLAGLLGANALLQSPLSNPEILDLAASIEKHPDNAAAALLGGFVVSTMFEQKVLARRIPIGFDPQSLNIVVVTPQFYFPTRKARSLLPKDVPHQAAVYNISRAVMLSQALEHGDLTLLGQAMEDVLHQPYRLASIPGAREAMTAAKRAGAAAVALSGAGPSLIAFSARPDPAIGGSMMLAFESAGLSVRIFQLRVSEKGAQVDLQL